jgi:hypothetical protein
MITEKDLADHCLLRQEVLAWAVFKQTSPTSEFFNDRRAAWLRLYDEVRKRDLSVNRLER